jgi:hypothetical protein
MLSGFFTGLITLNDPAFDFQLVRRGVVPEVLKRRMIMAKPVTGGNVTQLPDPAFDVLRNEGEKPGERS